MLRLLILLLVLPQLNCLIALPPTRTDVGATVAHDGSLHRAKRISSGMHWASGTRSRNVPFDLGAGMVYERSPSRATTGAVEQIDHAVGGYFEGASRLSASGAIRSWIGGRVELMRHTGSGESTAGLIARLSWEVYGGGTAAGGDGSSNAIVAFLAGGTIGVGPYIEAGVRQGSSGDTETLITAGVSLRLPAILGFAFGWR